MKIFTNIIVITNWDNIRFISGPKIKTLAGTDVIIAIGNTVKTILLNFPLYIESGLLEYLVISLASQPPTEKFLYQNTKQEIMNSIE